MILLYHLIFPDDTPADVWNAGLIIRFSEFQRQIHFLRKHYLIVTLEEYILARRGNIPSGKKPVAITFDDGYRNVFDLVTPFFEKESIPMTIFTNTGHLTNGELLWFVYINALCSERCYEKILINGNEHSLTTKKSSLNAWKELIMLARLSGNPIRFSRTLSQKYPLPQSVFRKYEGVTKEQLISIRQSKWIEIGGHTSNHPFLDQIAPSEQKDAIIENKHLLESMTQKQIHFFAYPGGSYTRESIEIVMQSGFRAAFAVRSRNLSEESKYEIPRIDIYSPNLGKFVIKLSFYNHIKKIYEGINWNE